MTITDEHRNIAARALAKCAANDPWFPQPNRATVEAWAEHIEHWKLGLDDVLAGVTKMYADNGSGFRPLPKDLVAAARAIRAVRTESETPAEREAREDRRDATLAARLAALDTAREGVGQAIPHIGTRQFHTKLAEVTAGFGKSVPDA